MRRHLLVLWCISLLVPTAPASAQEMAPVLRQPAPQSRPAVLHRVEQLWRAEVALAAGLVRYGSTERVVARTRHLERLGIATPGDLRVLAGNARDAAKARSSARTVRAAEASGPVLQRALAAVRLLYPTLPTDLDALQVAAALDAAAADGENRSITSWLRWARAAVSRGDLRTTGVNPSAVPAVLEPGVVVKSTTDDIAALYVDAATVRAQWEAYLDLQVRKVAATPIATGVFEQWRRTSPRRMAAVLTAVGAIGQPYVFAARGPTAFDCSGLTAYAWGQAGLALRTSSAAQHGQVDHVRSATALRPGDLVLRVDARMAMPGESSGHVGIVAAEVDGDLLVVHASNVADAVRSTEITDTRAWTLGKVRLAEERTDLPLPLVPIVRQR
jgi:hypothetical protein